MGWPASIYWVAAPGLGRIAVVGRPRSVAAFGELKAAGIDVLVSLLEREEAEDVGLGGEAGHCERAGIEFISVAVRDHGIPGTFEEIEAVVGRLRIHLAQGRGVGAHCFAGLGRSPLLVASVLIHAGYSDSDAIDLVSEARGHAVPEMDSQHAWLQAFAQRQAR
jgi:protein-tyrosine phosphatase